MYQVHGNEREDGRENVGAAALHPAPGTPAFTTQHRHYVIGQWRYLCLLGLCLCLGLSLCLCM